MKTKSVFVGSENCRVYDNFSIRRCRICCGYNHSIKTCREFLKRKQACLKCAGEHESLECESREKKCINCITANKYLARKRAVDHCADDVKNCESYKIKWEQYISDTDYPWKPEPPLPFPSI